MFKKMIISILISAFLITFVKPIVAGSVEQITENNRIIYSITEEEMLELYPGIRVMTMNVYEDGTIQIFARPGCEFEYDSRKICFDKVRFCEPEQPWWRIAGANYRNAEPQELTHYFQELTNSNFTTHLTEFILNSENCPSESIGQYEEYSPVSMRTYNSYILPVETTCIHIGANGNDIYTGSEVRLHIKEEYLSENPVIILYARDLPDECSVDDPEKNIKFEIPISNPPKDKDTYIQELENKITELENKIIELESQIPVSTNVGDVDNDGFIDSTDATWILSYYAYIMTGGDPTVTITNFISKTPEEEPSI